MAQFPHHGIEERQHERNCDDADALDHEYKDHGGSKSTVRAKLAVRGIKGYERICPAGVSIMSTLRQLSGIDPQFVHARDQRRALESETCGSALRSTDLPASALQHS